LEEAIQARRIICSVCPEWGVQFSKEYPFVAELEN
jgi:hypothetical protein